MPSSLGALSQFEDHVQHAVTTQTALAQPGAMADRGEGRFNRISGPNTLPMMGWEGIEGQQFVTVFSQAIRRLELGPQAAGSASFQWDGLKDDGQFASPGTYFVVAEASFDGNTEAVETLLASEVRSVTLSNSGGLLLDLKGIGSLDFEEVRQIL